MKYISYLISAIIVLAVFAIIVAWSYIFFDLAQETTKPDFMIFMGILPWMVLLLMMGCAEIDKKRH